MKVRAQGLIMSRQRSYSALGSLLLLLLWFAVPIHAQEQMGRLYGTVFDENRGSDSSGGCSLTNTETGLKTILVTHDLGAFNAAKSCGPAPTFSKRRCPGSGNSFVEESTYFQARLSTPASP